MTIRQKYDIPIILFCMVLIGGCYIVFKDGQDKARLASCRPINVLDTCYRYASEHDGAFPTLSITPGKLMFDGELYAKYSFNISSYYCDSDPELPEYVDNNVTKSAHVNDWSYAYLGYFIENEVQGLAFVEAYKKAAKADQGFDFDLTVPKGKGNLGSSTLHQLRKPDSLPDELSTLALNAAKIPMVIEWPGHHRHGVCQVSFLDGHTERNAYPGEFPLTEAFIKGLQELDAISEEEHPDLVKLLEMKAKENS